METPALTDLKASEVKLRETLKNEKDPEFKADIRWAYRTVRMRRIMAEQAVGIGRRYVL